MAVIWIKQIIYSERILHCISCINMVTVDLGKHEECATVDLNNSQIIYAAFNCIMF